VNFKSNLVLLNYRFVRKLNKLYYKEGHQENNNSCKGPSIKDIRSKEWGGGECEPIWTTKDVRRGVCLAIDRTSTNATFCVSESRLPVHGRLDRKRFFVFDVLARYDPDVRERVGGYVF